MNKNFSTIISIILTLFIAIVSSSVMLMSVGCSGKTSIPDETNTEISTTDETSTETSTSYENIDEISTPVVTLSTKPMVSVGGNHTVALKSDGTVWCWGFNDYGQLGDGTEIDSITPIQVLRLKNIATVSAGYLHTAALKSDGTVWCWGNNIRVKLGDGTITDRFIPVQTINSDGTHFNLFVSGEQNGN